MNNYYSSNPTFYVSVDCIIFGFNEDGLSLLLLKSCLLYTSDAADEL